jgi:hypothetical protein
MTWGSLFVGMKMAVFWVLVLYRLVFVYQHFRGLWCLHRHGSEWFSTDFWNVGKLIPVNMALQPRRRPSSSSPLFYVGLIHMLISIMDVDMVSMFDRSKYISRMDFGFWSQFQRSQHWTHFSLLHLCHISHPPNKNIVGIDSGIILKLILNVVNIWTCSLSPEWVSEMQCCYAVSNPQSFTVKI